MALVFFGPLQLLFSAMQVHIMSLTVCRTVTIGFYNMCAYTYVYVPIYY
jgi:hypothetical protein